MCNGNIKGTLNTERLERGTEQQSILPKCHLVHHFNPFLRIGAFKIEFRLYFPLRTIIHDFYSEAEMSWMKAYSRPLLSAARDGLMSMNPEFSTAVRSVESATTVINNNFKRLSNQVTLSIRDIKYDEDEIFTKISNRNEPLMYKVKKLKDPYKYTIPSHILFRVSKRTELATTFNLTARHGSSTYHATNYGLSGSLLTHIDPHGYEEGAPLTESRPHLMRTGDYIATFMGWFDTTIAGGNTAFVQKNYEGVIPPIKGSAGFWINLYTCHKKDYRSVHAGCPVLKGAKWIVNKWIYSWDQWQQWPCSLKPNLTFRLFGGMTW